MSTVYRHVVKKLSRASFIEFVTITMIFLFVMPIMFTLIVAILLNVTATPEIRIAQAGVIALVSGLILYGSVTYFLRKMHKQIVLAKMEED
jgi:hypothetical protein